MKRKFKFHTFGYYSHKGVQLPCARTGHPTYTGTLPTVFLSTGYSGRAKGATRMTNYQQTWRDMNTQKRRFRRDKRNPKRKNWSKKVVDMGNLDYVRIEEGYSWTIDSTVTKTEQSMVLVGGIQLAVS